jgi:hypothetical protein
MLKKMSRKLPYDQFVLLMRIAFHAPSSNKKRISYHNHAHSNN